MRTSPFAIANLAVIVAIAGATLAAVGSGRHTDFTAQTKQARAALDGDEPGRRGAERPRAARDGPEDIVVQAPWWSPAWWNDPGTSFIQDLEAGTDAVWNQAMSSPRTRPQHSSDGT